MPGLSGRMSTVISQDLKLLDRAEDLSETLESQLTRKQIELLQNVKKRIADVAYPKKRLQLQEEKYRGQVVKLDTQALSGSGRRQRGALRAPRWNGCGRRQVLSSFRGWTPQIAQLGSSSSSR